MSARQGNSRLVRPNLAINRMRNGAAPWPCDRLGSSSATRPGRRPAARRIALR